MRLPKSERLHGHNTIEQLFSRGKSFYVYPFKVVVFQEVTNDNPPLRMLISVSRRRFKKAPDRNRIKRLCREAWRMQKSELIEKLSQNNNRKDVALIYTAGSILPFTEISQKIKVILLRLMDGYEDHN
ncbi:MAG: ribonuclease P protein component [Bacteroidetes bacterium]|jgi:ribonuclease P protein component|nr:ribonuclease P protein component [Bacteroidota bacterium]